MYRHQVNAFLQVLLTSGILLASFGYAWADSNNCVYPSEKGDGGSSINGTGMGGTGDVSGGTGMGGTGIKQGGAWITLRALAGHVISSQGEVMARYKGQSRALAKGDPICVGETITTSQSGRAQIKMLDDGLVAVRSKTELKIEKFIYGRAKQDGSLFALLDGACRVVTGKIGKKYPQNDLIKTPTAIIGVLGTDHEARVVLPGDAGKYPPGTYDKVNFGITFIRTSKGKIDIHPEQVGYSASANELPVLLWNPPDFYQGHSSKEGNKDEHSEAIERNKHLGQPDKDAEHDGQAKIEARQNENSDIQSTLDGPRTPTAPDVPEVIEVPEVPDVPTVPEVPDVPDVPEPSDTSE